MSETRKFHLYRLCFEGGWHLSRGRPGLERGGRTLHSDKLMSAMFVALLQLQDCDRSFFDGIRISSAFPFIGESFFFPVPTAGVKWKQEGGLSEKKLKKVKYLEKELFEDCLAGKPVDLGKGHIREGLAEFAFGSKQETKKNAALPFRHSVRNQVAIPLPPVNPLEPRGDARPFAVERTLAGKDAGLFFLASFLAAGQWEALLPAALNVLADEGIGAKRSTGLGVFSWKKESFSLKVPVASSHSLNLGLYSPQKEEASKELLQKSSYQLVQRGGYASHAASMSNRHYRKKAAFLFREGGSFPGTPTGKLLNLAPDILEGVHPVWREGRPLFLPFKPANSLS